MFKTPRTRPFQTSLLLLAAISLEAALGQTDALPPTITPGTYQPTGDEEEIRWLTNRARHAPEQEDEIQGTNYYSRGDLIDPRPPLAPHPGLTAAARHHSEDMARNNEFTHNTVEGSAYYDADSQPNLVHRMVAEGYSWRFAAENIAAGRPTPAGVHSAWWKSDDHRINMLRQEVREIGNGSFFDSSSRWGIYRTMVLGSSWDHHFVTGNLFHDRNGDGRYNAGEGLPELVLHLRVDGTDHPRATLSGQAGDVTIPLRDINPGASIEVLVTNRGEQATTLSIPRDATSLEALQIVPGQPLVIGTFTKHATPTNVGLRDLISPLPTPALTITRAPGGVSLRWPTQPGLHYQLQSSPNLLAWTDQTTELSGNGAPITRVLSVGPSEKTFFRVVARRSGEEGQQLLPSRTQ